MTIEQILEAIEQMKVTELNELVKAAEEKFGVSASAPVIPGQRKSSCRRYRNEVPFPYPHPDRLPHRGRGNNPPHR